MHAKHKKWWRDNVLTTIRTIKFEKERDKTGDPRDASGRIRLREPEDLLEVDDSDAGVARLEKEEANFARSTAGRHILMLQKRIERLEAIIRDKR